MRQKPKLYILELLSNNIKMGRNYVPFARRAIASTLVTGMLFLSMPRVSSGNVTTKVDFDQNQTSFGVQYLMRFGKSKQDYPKEGMRNSGKEIIDTPVISFNTKIPKFKDPYSSNLSKFVRGLTRPAQMYGQDSNKGFQFYPFLSKPFKVGGIFSPLTKKAWDKDFFGTAGTLFSELAMITIGILSSIKRDKKDSYRPSVYTQQIPPATPSSGGGSGGSEDEDEGDTHGGDPY